jgi:hypothetical protein
MASLRASEICLKKEQTCVNQEERYNTLLTSWISLLAHRDSIQRIHLLPSSQATYQHSNTLND